MAKKIWIQSALLVACGVLLGIGIDRGWQHGVIPTLAAQQGRPPLPTMESLPEEVSRLKALVPSNLHIMMDVQSTANYSADAAHVAVHFAPNRREWSRG